MLEAREEMFFFRFPVYSVRIGQVPVTEKPASITASRKVSQPVLEVPASPFFSDCLKHSRW